MTVSSGRGGESAGAPVLQRTAQKEATEQRIIVDVMRIYREVFTAGSQKERRVTRTFLDVVLPTSLLLIDAEEPRPNTVRRLIR
jgi:hypothetical protein